MEERTQLALEWTGGFAVRCLASKRCVGGWIMCRMEWTPLVSERSRRSTVYGLSGLMLVSVAGNTRWGRERLRTVYAACLIRWVVGSPELR